MAYKITWDGWRPDLPDYRDLKYATPRSLMKELPIKVDLRKLCPPVYDQGEIGSCTANAIAAAYKFDLMRQNKSIDFFPSRLFIYYNGRVIENIVNIDNGAEIRDGVKSLNKQGVCPEEMLPYDVNKFADKPSDPCYKAALDHQILSYHRLQRTLEQMKGCLVEGFPFVFGFTVYDSFESNEVNNTGKLNMPMKGEKILGGHAVLAVGYNDIAKRFIACNSWGTYWGLNGYFTIPYGYLTEENLSDDFWTIRAVEN